MRFATSSQPCDVSVVFEELETLIVRHQSQYSPTNMRYFYASHKNLRTLESHNGCDLTLEVLSQLSPSLTRLVFAKAPEFFTPFAVTLPRGLKHFEAICLQIAADALEHLPERLETLALGTQVSMLVPDVSKLPRTLTSLSGNLEFDEAQCRHLPRGLRTLPGVGQNWSLDKEHLRFAEFPPALEDLAIYYASPELLLALKCSKTLTKLYLNVTHLSQSHALCLHRFTVLKTLALPVAYFESFIPFISKMQLESLEAIAKDGATYDAYTDLKSLNPNRAPGVWVPALPRTLTRLDTPLLYVEPFEFCDLPPKLQSLKARVYGSIEIQDLGDLPRTLTDLSLAVSKPSVLNVSAQTLASVLPGSATAVSWIGIDVALSDPHSTPDVVLKPLLAKCPGLTELFFGGSHPYPDGTTWLISQQISRLVAHGLPEDTRGHMFNFWRQ